MHNTILSFVSVWARLLSCVFAGAVQRGGEGELRTGRISSRNCPDSRRMFYISQEYIITTTLLHEYHDLTSVIEQ